MHLSLSRCLSSFTVRQRESVCAVRERESVCVVARKFGIFNKTHPSPRFHSFRARSFYSSV